MRDGKLIHFVIRADAINDLQLNSIRYVMKRARAAHFTNIDMRINGKSEISEADWLKHFREVVPGDAATPTGHAAEEAECVHLCLDDRRVPRQDANGKVFSLWGRVCEYMRMHAPADTADCQSSSSEAELKQPARPALFDTASQMEAEVNLREMIAKAEEEIHALPGVTLEVLK